MTIQQPRSSSPVLWGQVFSLAVVQGAIVLAWVIYNLYLVQLLTRLGFAQELATGLLVLENLLAMIVEPIMGNFSDRLQHQMGTRFPFIALGMILAAGCFLALPIVVVAGGAGLRRLLPLLLVAWALTMTTFRSPALSLLGRYAFRTQLPQAASILTLVGGLAGAAGPLANTFILSLGPLVAFSLGSGVLLLAAAVLHWSGPNEQVSPAAVTSTSGLSWPKLALVFGTGVGVSLGFRMVMTTFPTVLKQQVPTTQPALVMGIVFVALAATALPAGALAVSLGNRRAMILGLAVMSLSTAIMSTVTTTILAVVVALLFGASFSLVSNGTIPFALSMVSPDKAGLGTGMYFSGAALAASLSGTLNLASGFSFLLGAFAFLAAGLCISITARRPYRSAS